MITEVFKTKFSELAKKFENEKLKIYDDGGGVPTIGIGFALINKMKDKTWKAYSEDFLKDRGLNLTDEQYEIIKAYAYAKSTSNNTNELKKQLDVLDFTITLETSSKLLEYSIEQKYKEIEKHIGKEVWNNLGTSRQIG